MSTMVESNSMKQMLNKSLSEPMLHGYQIWNPITNEFQRYITMIRLFKSK